MTDDVKESKALLNPNNTNRALPAKILNGAIVVLGIPYQIYGAPLAIEAITSLTGSRIFGVTATVILLPISYSQDLLRLYPAENIEALQHDNPLVEIKYPVRTTLLRTISALVYALDGSKDAIALVWLFGGSDTAKIIVYALSSIIIPAYWYYSYVLYDHRLIAMCNQLPEWNKKSIQEFFSHIYKEFKQQPALATETLITSIVLGLNKFVSAGAVLIQLWSKAPQATVYLMMSKSMLINLVTRISATLKIHHNAKYKDLTVKELSKVKINIGQYGQFVLLASVRGVPAGALGRIFLNSNWGSLLGLPFFFHRFYVDYKAYRFEQALERRQAKQVPMDHFDILISKYHTPSLKLFVLVQNGLVNLLQLLLAYQAGDLVLDYFLSTTPKEILAWTALFLVPSMLSATTKVVTEDVMPTIKSVLAKNLLVKTMQDSTAASSSTLVRVLGIFCCKSRRQLLAEGGGEYVEQCLDSFPKDVVATPVPQIKTTNTPVQSAESAARVHSGSFSGIISSQASAGYGSMWQPAPEVIVRVAANNTEDIPAKSCWQRFRCCLGW